MNIKLNDRQSVIDAIAADLHNEQAHEYFNNEAELKKFCAFVLKNSPFGIKSAMSGFGPESIKKHKITADEIYQAYHKSLKIGA